MLSERGLTSRLLHSMTSSPVQRLGTDTQAQYVYRHSADTTFAVVPRVHPVEGHFDIGQNSPCSFGQLILHLNPPGADRTRLRPTQPTDAGELFTPEGALPEQALPQHREFSTR